MPDVDHVIFYEAVPSEIRSIQRRGRTGRTSVGKVTVLMAEGTVDEAYYYSSRRKEERMRHLLETVKRRKLRPERARSTLLDYSTIIELTEMSIKVKEWLRRLGIDTTHEEREEIDREIERQDTTILRQRS